MNKKLFNKNWSAKIDKSLFSKKTKPLTETRLYEKGKKSGYRLTVRGTRPNGSNYEWGYEAKKDGKAFPIYGREDADAIIAYKVTEEITIGDFLKKGKIVAAYKRSISKDGKKLTVVFAGIDNKNKPYFNVIEYV